MNNKREERQILIRNAVIEIEAIEKGQGHKGIAQANEIITKLELALFPEE